MPKLSEFRVKNTLILIYIHLVGIWGFARIPYLQDIRYLYVAIALYVYSGLGVTAGLHRLWAHKSYKTIWPIKLFLLLGTMLAGQGSVIHWSRDHRLHHKFSETDADPHNSERGFVFSHVGWLFLRKSKRVIEEGNKLDLSDLRADPILVFQDRYYTPLMFLFNYLLPTVIFGHLWGSYKDALLVSCVARHLFVLHATWFVNSVAHWWGPRPYNSTIGPAENLFVAIFALGEGWHNYHHVVSWDYKTSETLWCYNPTAWLIKLLSFVGLTFDLKQASDELIQRYKAKNESRQITKRDEEWDENKLKEE